MIVLEEAAQLATPSGPMRCTVVRPAQGLWPGLLLYSEIFQLTGPIRRLAAYYAGNGYVVAVPEIFHELEPAGTVLAYDAAGADKGNADKIGKSIGAYDDDAAACITHLKSHAACTGPIGAIGWCIGGGLALRAALHPSIQAAACFYATDIHKGTLGKGGDDTLARFNEIKGEVCLIWGRQDPHIPAEGRALLQAALNAAKVNYTWHELNGAHAFLRDEGPRYDANLARVAHPLALDLFARTLR